MKDYYNILGVSKDASTDEIRKAYRKLAQIYHPDTHRENKAFYENKMKELNEASSVLLHSVKKREYDYMLAAERERLKREVKSPKQTVKQEPTIKQKKDEIKNAFSQDKRFKILTIFFIIQSVIALLVISISLYLFFGPSSQQSTPSYLNFGQSKQQVINLLGNPKAETKHLLIYDDYQIIMYLDKVDGWLNAKNKLPLGPQRTLHSKDIKTGDDIIRIVDTYGNPDTFSKELAVYDNIVLYLEDGKVKTVEIVY